ncbi:MAG: glycosyltransferase family 4 protein, partial [bacterium]
KPFDALCLWKAHTQLCMPRRPDTSLKVWTDVRRNQRANGRLHRLLLPSRYVLDLLVRSGMDPGLLEVLHLYAPIGKEAAANAPAPARHILALGRLTPEKGFQHLIEALPHIEAPTVLEIGGDGPYAEELRRLAARAPERHTVLFSGAIPRGRISEAFARARVAAVPSIWPEPFGIVGLEAMAHGLPAVAFDVGGIRDWLADGETGALVPRKDIPALARALDAYLSDPGLAQRHGAAGREAVRKRFLPERHISRLLEVFEEAAGASVPARADRLQEENL